jgi:tetratricopeptide (TPR) repeat protein
MAVTKYLQILLLCQSANPDATCEFFDMALELYPLYPKAWLNKAITYQHKGDITEALICFDKAIDLNKNFKGVFRLFLPKIMIIRQFLLNLKK